MVVTQIGDRGDIDEAECLAWQNALVAMPADHIAAPGAAATGSRSTLISLPIGGMIDQD